MSDQPGPAPDLLDLTAQIVSAHLRKARLPPDALPGVIQAVYEALRGTTVATAKASRAEPAVPANRSVFPDYIVCLEDGKKLKTLKRHLQTAYNMTPGQYREKWGLPAHYPMIAPSYAKYRSDLAKELGLGRKPRAASTPTKPTKAAQQARTRGTQQNLPTRRR
jgi:predicted transcriptional regulator